jgi:hypothetical protein
MKAALPVVTGEERLRPAPGEDDVGDLVPHDFARPVYGYLSRRATGYVLAAPVRHRPGTLASQQTRAPAFRLDAAMAASTSGPVSRPSRDWPGQPGRPALW